MPNLSPLHPTPACQPRPSARIVHGVELADDFAWLRADNWQEVMRDPSALPADIRSYLEAENAYAEAVMAPTAALQEALYKEIRGRIKEDDSTVPAADGPYAYASRYRDGGQHPIFVRTPRNGGDETILLDGDALAAGKAYFRLASAGHSPDHRLLAWGADDKGSEFFTLRLCDIASGVDLADEISETSGGAVWANDGKTFFYVHVDENHRPSRVLAHVVGTPIADDRVVYEEADPGFFVGLSKTQSGRYVSIDVHDHETSEVRLIEAERPDSAPVLIAARQTAVEYDVDHGDDRLFIRTNAKDAKDFCIVTAPLASPGRENWQELVPHRPGVLILGVTVYKRHLVRLERADGLPRIVIHRLADGGEHRIAFDEEAYSLGLIPSFEFDTDMMRFSYSSMTTPARVYDYDMETRQRTLRKEQEVPSGHDPARFVTRRIQAPAGDGELVPISLIHLKDTAVDGTAPLLLYGYGAYGITIPAAFSVSILSLVERGFVYAIAHVRGGQDKGYDWYANGRREHKTNTFDDFVAGAQALIAAGYTAKGRIVAHGGSAGGMLMGAIANQAGELFGGIIAEVPFVDVLTTMLDDTLPLTPPEWPEWGNPITDEAAFRLIRSYSPVDNVEAKPYPPILALAGLTDPRVTYWEPAKWVARLRALKTDDNVLVLKTNMDAGHGGAAGRFDRLKEVALSQAFALGVVDKAEG
ncbi:MAG: S9 family peptidase [Ancalomicrobiaceae bacterium]|nr:S9 family peptidase [Ancalomicrobiaceae bacterium]